MRTTIPYRFFELAEQIRTRLDDPAWSISWVIDEQQSIFTLVTTRMYTHNEVLERGIDVSSPEFNGDEIGDDGPFYLFHDVFTPDPTSSNYLYFWVQNRSAMKEIKEFEDEPDDTYDE